MKHLTFILLGLLTLTGCTFHSMEDILLRESEISLSWRGEQQVVYVPSEFQLAFNDRDNEFRVYSDRLGEWFTVKCSEKPSAEGQLLKADVSWTASKSTKQLKSLDMKVEKTDEEGLIWLWNSSHRVGIIIKDIQ
jgi:hypothetical protein